VSATNEKNGFALVQKPSSAVEKVAPGARRVLSGMMTDTLALAKKARPFRIVHHEDQGWLLETIGLAIHQKFENVVIDTFQNGDKTWEELLRADPDLLITDLFNDDFSSRTANIGTNEIFGMSGFDLLTLLQLKKVKYPILVTSALVESGREPKNRRLEQEYWPDLNLSFLTKPFTTDQFYPELDKHINTGVRYSTRQGLAKDQIEAIRKTVEQGYKNTVEKIRRHIAVCRSMGATERKSRYSDAEIATLLNAKVKYAEAVKWDRLAAEQGDVRAQTNLGISYYNGRGVEKNYSEAVKWYRKSAEQGCATAQNNLGFCYEKGQGVPLDFIEAYKFYKLAAEQNPERAAENLKSIVTRMTAVEIAEGERCYLEFYSQKNLSK
jgi:hypothetical protein